ncbi:hypothetical protein ACWGJT_22335 [Streptomyces xantholiticus]
MDPRAGGAGIAVLPMAPTLAVTAVSAPDPGERHAPRRGGRTVQPAPERKTAPLPI